MVVSEKEMLAVRKHLIAVPIVSGEAIAGEAFNWWIERPRKRKIIIPVASDTAAGELIGSKVLAL